MTFKIRASTAFTNTVLETGQSSDMGDDLADGVPELEAMGREWRTPPLWGLGLLRSIHGRLRLLHDGRARSVEEAVLWHGGEAEPARERFKHLSRSEREMVVRFVESL